MGDRKASLARRYPLHLKIAFAFTALLLVIGLTLISFNYLETRFAGEGFQSRSLLSVPLKNQLDEVIGVLQLVNAEGSTASVPASIPWSCPISRPCPPMRQWPSTP
jgi:hypothetical protein